MSIPGYQFRDFFAISTKKNAGIMLLKILTHSMAGSVTFCFDGCFVKRFQHVSSAIVHFKDLSVIYRIATVQ